ncbi:hypothetical protein BCR44DRAFT_292325 [Catenaria anguillulae PL171]|uniref:Secreted protein n=1 Tax=Catenaria anguillulae PL171 TaxID=765915 RepID=A0A1Y2HV81_9FUNG|nr:hypothetical protein BCR44DRAFT_292325 [Catenaria anguillulae PL171]
MFANHLSYAQRRSLSNSLVWVTALTAVLTVAAPTLLPCPVAHGKGHILGDEAEHDENEVDDHHQDDQLRQPRGTVACLAAAGSGNWCPMSMFGSMRSSRSRTNLRDDMPKVCVAWPNSSRGSGVSRVAGSTSSVCQEEVVVR